MKKWRVDFNESLHPEPWRDFYARYFPELDRMDIKEDGFTVQSLKCLYHERPEAFRDGQRQVGLLRLPRLRELFAVPLFS
ncbi:MAG: hypothetical protein ACOX3V_04880 [Bacillota bacterium]